MDRLTKELEVLMKMEVERFMANGQHFSHQHPLSLTIPSEEDEDDDDDDESCSICGLPIFSSPSYTCTTISCNFFLHKQCALEFPHYLLLPTHCPNTKTSGHALYLHKPNLSSSSSSSSSSNLIYSCFYCQIEIHPLSTGVGVKIEIEIKHRSHPSHPLVAAHREVSCECDGCGRKQEGFFFTCHVCNFWIHRDCTVLPSIITLLDQPYPFFLAYSLSPYQIMAARCLVCRKPLFARSGNLGVYLCPQSGTFAHVACGTHRRSASETRDKVMMQLPEEERVGFPSRVIRRYAKSIVGTSPDDDADAAHDLKIQNYHKQHPLILISNNASSNSSNNSTKKTKKKQLLACDLCTQPIDTSSSSSSSSSSFHRCENRACQFAAHSICADILPNITKFFVPGFWGRALDTDILLPDNRHRSMSLFNSVFYCRFCRRPCNGACSYVHSPLYHDYPPWCIDMECMAAPITVSHASHPRHLLFRTHRRPSAAGPRLTCCAAHTSIYDVYRCITCDYVIHISCAMLPKRIHFPQYHRLHPLYLIYDTTDASVGAGGLFCEVCEKGIDLRYWMYRCVECDEWYHINCIPSVGYLSKVKFGGTLTLPSSVHAHPLTLERMLDVPSQRCGDCKKIIHGMVDEMAFFCSLCHFWLHFSCARNSAARLTSDHPLLYSELRRLQDRSNVMSLMGLR